MLPDIASMRHPCSRGPNTHAGIEENHSSTYLQCDKIRKRVCKACDRCRLKKTKCDGASPCLRCQTDQVPCIFGERKKTSTKVYPKGYVQMLEQQQHTLVRGLLELYQRTTKGKGWPGEPLELQSNGHPLTHVLLERLDVLGDYDHSDIEESPRPTQVERCVDGIQCQIVSTEGLDSSTVLGDQSPLNPWDPQATFPVLPTDTQKSSKQESMSPAIHSSTSIKESDCFLRPTQWPLNRPAGIYDPNTLTADFDCSDLEFYTSFSQPIFACDEMMPEYSLLFDNLSFDQNSSAEPMGPASNVLLEQSYPD